MIEIKNKANCCGCTACYSICPKKCIKMKEDNEGFLYPIVNKEKCTDCGLCEKVCPILSNKKEEKFEQYGYLFQHKNDDIRRQSTSGGAFTGIAEYVLDKNGVVYGAMFDENFKVIHKMVNEKEELYKFRNSKYVQSDMKNCFIEIKELLEDNRLVCFSGTPCQVEGLKKSLSKEYENLITVDMVCRAVPSPLVWQKYLKYIKRKYLGDSEIESVLFRDKSKYGYKYSTMTIKTDKKEYRNGVETDPYLRAFFSNLSDRLACYDCKFKKQYRVSDFTIWDCLTVEEFEKELDDDKGTTRILVHTKKGKEILESIKSNSRCIEIPAEKLIENFKEMYHSVSINSKRENFFKDINTMNEEEVFNKYFPDSIKVKLERNARIFLARTSVYKKIKKVAKKLLRK